MILIQSWGRNNNGQLGDNTNINRHIPVHIMDDVASVSANFETSAAIKNDGSLWVWGNLGSRIPAFRANSPEYWRSEMRTVSFGSGYSLMVEQQESDVRRRSEF